MSIRVPLSAVIAPSFHGVYREVQRGTCTHFWLKGGRGSTKSSFAAVAIVLGMMQRPDANAVVLRRVADTLRDSVYEQLLWAIDKLGVSHLWSASLAPLRLTYTPTGQRILFKGADDPRKIKSVKFSKGVLGYVWYEELAEFKSMEDIRTINQSLIRGTDIPTVFYSYNPPASPASWVNEEAGKQALRDDVLVHESTYLSVPSEWLGEQFIAEADHLREINPRKYQHEYMGEATGTGAEVFGNIVLRRVSDRQIAMFDKTHHGLDFGFASDPTAYVGTYYNPAKQRLVIYDEVYRLKLPTDALAAELKTRLTRGTPVIADSAEPRTIHDLRGRDIPVLGAKKGPGSVDHGIKWLSDLAEIIIDPARCPNTAREFTRYEVGRDQHGNLNGTYPDKDNHSIDATRYATEPVRKAWLV